MTVEGAELLLPVVRPSGCGYEGPPLAGYPGLQGKVAGFCEGWSERTFTLVRTTGGGGGGEGWPA